VNVAPAPSLAVASTIENEGPSSSSAIVARPFRSAIVAPVARESMTRKVSLASSTESPRTLIDTFLDALAGVNRTVPLDAE
jgi:hypothetical protein